MSLELVKRVFQDDKCIGYYVSDGSKILPVKIEQVYGYAKNKRIANVAIRNNNGFKKVLIQTVFITLHYNYFTITFLETPPAVTIYIPFGQSINPLPSAIIRPSMVYIRALPLSLRTYSEPRPPAT